MVGGSSNPPLRVKVCVAESEASPSDTASLEPSTFTTRTSDEVALIWSAKVEREPVEGRTPRMVSVDSPATCVTTSTEGVPDTPCRL